VAADARRGHSKALAMVSPAYNWSGFMSARWAAWLGTDAGSGGFSSGTSATTGNSGSQFVSSKSTLRRQHQNGYTEDTGILARWTPRSIHSA
jgi:hypothetical protein